MIKTVENRIGKSIYGILQVGLLVLTLFTFKPDSPDMPDDFRTIGLLFLMGLLSFPISLIAAPVAFGLSFAIVGILSLLVGQFTDVRHFSPFPESAFIFLSWLGMFICGYRQWFGFPQRAKNPLRTIRKQHS
jgi:hypothetical protein